MTITAEGSSSPLQAGEVVWIDVDPVVGTEQAGVRPALVISDSQMHTLSRRAIVCPITTDIRPWPTKVFLPDGLPVRGAVLVDQVRSMDRAARVLRRMGAVPRTTLVEVREMLAALVGIDLSGQPSATI